MTYDYKQLCNELLSHLYQCDWPDGERFYALVERVRAALAEPGPDGLPIWTEGICGDGAALLRDGAMVPIEEVVRELNRGAQARAGLAKPEPKGPSKEQCQ